MCGVFELSDFAQKKCGKKSDSNWKIEKNFTKDFPVKKNPRESFVK